MFLDAQNDNYHLLWSSPCVHAGDNNAPGLPAEDLDGYPRIQFGRTSETVDMGAYEFGKYFTFTDMVRTGGSTLAEGDVELTWCSSANAGVYYDLYRSDEDFSDSMAWTSLYSNIPTAGAFSTSPTPSLYHLLTYLHLQRTGFEV